MSEERKVGRWIWICACGPKYERCPEGVARCEVCGYERPPFDHGRNPVPVGPSDKVPDRYTVNRIVLAISDGKTEGRWTIQDVEAGIEAGYAEGRAAPVVPREGVDRERAINAKHREGFERIREFLRESPPDVERAILWCSDSLSGYTEDALRAALSGSAARGREGEG